MVIRLIFDTSPTDFRQCPAIVFQWMFLLITLNTGMEIPGNVRRQFRSARGHVFAVGPLHPDLFAEDEQAHQRQRRGIIAHPGEVPLARQRAGIEKRGGTSLCLLPGRHDRDLTPASTYPVP